MLMIFHKIRFVFLILTESRYKLHTKQSRFSVV
jgi:hypothetical protein